MLAEFSPRSGIQFFRIAKRVSKQSSYKIKIGAVLVDKRPLSSGFNKLKTHPMFAVPGVHTKLSLHAEISCIMGARGKDIRGASIYVYREDKLGNPRMSKPCSSCMESLKKAGIKKCFYSTDKYPYYECEIIG